MRASNSRFLHAIFGLFVLATLNLAADGLALSASESILWNFGTGIDGTNPQYGPLFMDAHGNFYGTTAGGGPYGGGMVFKLTPPTATGGNWTESGVWNFGDGVDGKDPVAGLIVDNNGNLYGTTASGGSSGGGTVFELTPPQPGIGGWTESILWCFSNNPDGEEPVGGLIMDTSGNLYGTTLGGGVNNGGTVFELTPPAAAGDNWTESILWNFGSGADGASPYGTLIKDTNGNLYGTTSAGGAHNGGMVFELSPAGSGIWTEVILWNFNTKNGDGYSPQAGLLMDTHGNLYGTTSLGGVDSFYGAVFELIPPEAAGDNWTESILWNFDGSANNDGDFPLGALIMDASANLYGSTKLGGSDGEGMVFELKPSTVGRNWTESILWNFDDVSNDDGEQPEATLIMDSKSNLYGTTAIGGRDAAGTVFEISNLNATSSPTPTPTPTSSAIPTSTATPTATATSTPSATPTRSATPTLTPTPSATPTLTATPTPSMTPTPPPTPSPTPTVTSDLSLSPSALNFGNVDATSSSKTEKLTLQNLNPVEAQIGQLSAPSSFTLSSDHCSNKVLKIKKKCTVKIAFAPTAIAPLSESFLIPNSGTTSSMILQGTGVAVTLSAPASKTLPETAVGEISASRSIVINNKSGAIVELGAASAITNFTITSDKCTNTTLKAAHTCVVKVKFAPPNGSASGATLSSTLSYKFTYGANNGLVSVPLDGTVK